jgi:hypothetical protein
LLRCLSQKEKQSTRNTGRYGKPMSASQRPLPRLARVLGYAGLIPFIALAAMTFASDPAEQAVATFALRAYAVTIVSFLGAIHWGLAMRQPQANTVLLWWGITPSLVGWVSLLVAPIAGSLILAATLWLCFVVDRRVYPQFGLQAWLGMRLVLTTVASASCVIASGLL